MTEPTSTQGNATPSGLPQRLEPSRGHWGLALVVACFALGVTLSWGAFLRRMHSADLVRLQDLDVIASQQSDLGQLLADPGTQLIRLSPADDAERGYFSPVHNASVVWNDQRQVGILFCGQTVGQRYRLSLMSAADRPTEVDLPPTSPGRTVYPFIVGDRISPLREVVLSTDQSARPLARGLVP